MLVNMIEYKQLLNKLSFQKKEKKRKKQLRNLKIHIERSCYKDFSLFSKQ